MHVFLGVCWYLIVFGPGDFLDVFFFFFFFGGGGGWWFSRCVFCSFFMVFGTSGFGGNSEAGGYVVCWGNCWVLFFFPLETKEKRLGLDEDAL